MSGNTPILLSPRLQTVADFVPCGSRFADIGTDHGYLPLYLLQQQRIATAIAADLNKGPLERARAMSEEYQIPLDLRLSDGLEKITPEEVDVVAIAGMGGQTMVHILEKWTKKQSSPWQGRFLLQPMSTQYELRHWLVTHGFLILKEVTVQEEKQLYTVMEVEKGISAHYTEGELRIGKQDLSDPLRQVLLSYWIHKTKQAQSKVPSHQQARSEELENRLAEFEKMLESCTKL